LHRRRTTDRKDGRAVMSLTEKPSLAQQESCPLVWGVDGISQVIGRTPRQAHHLLERGFIKSARKVGGRWCANREKLIAELSGEFGAA
jgi:hypothetical protein